MPDGRASLVLVFGSDPDVKRLQRPLAEVARVWAEHVVLGCSTPAHLPTDATSASPIPPSIVLTVARFDRTELQHCHVDVAAAGGPRAAGRAIATQMASPSLRGVFVVGDGTLSSGATLAAGFAERLPGIALTGGFAAETDTVPASWTLVDGMCRSGHVSAVGFVSEHLELGFGTAGGWDVFGPERLVTQSYGNVLYELDGRPALSLYADYVDAAADDLAHLAVGFPFAIRDLDDRTVVRAVTSVNTATDSLRLAGDVSQGAVAQLLQSSPDHLVEGAHLAAGQASIGSEQLAIAISCVGRRRVLGNRTGEELDAAREALAADVHVTGFYSLGTLAPAIGGSDHHNQVMTITTMREHADPVSA